ncbi:hypothetical protein BGZ47_003363 [Haplosporangium gracile]|nr:hypothetical protein BGZ47_003363 [Haplosporangium gracile]
MASALRVLHIPELLFMVLENLESAGISNLSQTSRRLNPALKTRIFALALLTLAVGIHSSYTIYTGTPLDLAKTISGFHFLKVLELMILINDDMDVTTWLLVRGFILLVCSVSIKSFKGEELDYVYRHFLKSDFHHADTDTVTDGGGLLRMTMTVTRSRNYGLLINLTKLRLPDMDEIINLQLFAEVVNHCLNVESPAMSRRTSYTD